MAQYNIQCDQYATWTLTVIWEDSSGTPVNLTGYTAEMVIANTQNTTLSTANGRIVLGTTNGTITLTLPASVTSSFVEADFNSQYDLLMNSPASVKTRLLFGSFTVAPGITTSTP